MCLLNELNGKRSIYDVSSFVNFVFMIFVVNVSYISVNSIYWRRKK